MVSNSSNKSLGQAKSVEVGAKIYKVRGIRGAISVPENSAEAIYAATQELLLRIFEENQLNYDDIGSIFFTTTRDLDAGFPAFAARKLGLTDIALMCGHEMEVPGALPRTLRVLLHVNTTKSGAELRHVYLGDAVTLRPDKTSSTEKI
ncbi:MAG: chorismate mutase [Chloroflexota bacterium]|nr:chorismate mutase [Chloroflexota bacterium]